jgi:hypothetical protein
VFASQSAVPVHDGVCFHCQQCAEKYLKGLLEEKGLAIPKTHTLVLLLATLVTHHPELRAFRRGLIFLTPFAVETRYPGDSATNARQERLCAGPRGCARRHGSSWASVERKSVGRQLTAHVN